MQIVQASGSTLRDRRAIGIPLGEVAGQLALSSGLNVERVLVVTEVVTAAGSLSWNRGCLSPLGR